MLLHVPPLMMQKKNKKKTQNSERERQRERRDGEWRADREACGAAWAFDRQTYWQRLYHEPFDGRFHPQHLNCGWSEHRALSMGGCWAAEAWQQCRCHAGAIRLQNHWLTDRQTDRGMKRQGGCLTAAGFSRLHVFLPDQPDRKSMTLHSHGDCNQWKRRGLFQRVVWVCDDDDGDGDDDDDEASTAIIYPGSTCVTEPVKAAF